jgi:hypothetical protein
LPQEVPRVPSPFSMAPSLMQPTYQTFSNNGFNTPAFGYTSFPKAQFSNRPLYPPVTRMDSMSYANPPAPQNTSPTLTPKNVRKLYRLYWRSIATL